MRSIHRSLLLSGLALLAAAGPALSQGAQALPSVFFDCDGRDCRSDYYRTEIGWVNWVNDRQVSDIHLIMSSLTTGAGGREYQLDFIGMGDHVGYEDRIFFQTLPTDTERERYDGITHAIGVGMARFAVTAGFRDIVALEGPDPESSPGVPQRIVSQQEVDDPWNLWVFRVNGNARIDGEETRKNRRYSGGFNASRVTPGLKLNFNGSVEHNNRERELSTGTFADIRTDWSFSPLIAYAIAEHWSLGVTGQLARETQQNQGFRAEIAPALEYSVFPYEEATRRALTFFYQIGPSYQSYLEPTIYLKNHETQIQQSLEIEFSQRQPWGDASITLAGSQYLHDPAEFYNVELRGNVEYRIVRGVSVNLRGNVGRVKDQIYLPSEGATDAETLLELQDRATDFEYCLSAGFSIQFGSIFNNVVNNRFRGVGGFGGFGGFGGGGGGCRGGFG